jgi:hypothetical protein
VSSPFLLRCVLLAGPHLPEDRFEFGFACLDLRHPVEGGERLQIAPAETVRVDGDREPARVDVAPGDVDPELAPDRENVHVRVRAEEVRLVAKQRFDVSALIRERTHASSRVANCTLRTRKSGSH